ncbi:MAG TPA: SigE family RNA polymerase sigma factor [Micromonosporaceae bacterium]|jgi:RNA polymerase sigma-70 factor (ECF subfamily)
MSVLALERPHGTAADAAATAADAAAVEFDAFYQASFAALLTVAYAHTGDPAEAQDLCQEAYCRAWQRWSAVARYDNPAAWVSRVVVNLARSRWRHAKVVHAHDRRTRHFDVPGLGPDHVAIVAALRALPVEQRRAVVLHYILDLAVADVAHEMGAPAGTVKSWLYRGRAALAAHLEEIDRPDRMTLRTGGSYFR